MIYHKCSYYNRRESEIIRNSESKNKWESCGWGGGILKVNNYAYSRSKTNNKRKKNHVGVGGCLFWIVESGRVRK